jgi:hypothetical protein
MSASVPVSTRSPARRMATREAKASTSLKMWDDNNTVWPATLASSTQRRNLLHQRLEPGRRLVEQQQIGSGHERRDQAHHLAVALRVGPHLLGRVEPEALDELVPVADVDRAMDPAQQVQGLGARQARPQRRLAGHVRQPPVRGDGVAMGIKTEDLGSTATWPQQTEQQPDRRRLPSPVRTQVAQHLPFTPLEVQLRRTKASRSPASRQRRVLRSAG